MVSRTRALCTAAALVALLAGGASPAWSQQKQQGGKKKEAASPAITLDVAFSATKEILIGHGFEVVSVETKPDRQIVTYRAGNRGNGRGKGPPVRLVIRRVDDRIVLDDAPETVRLEVAVKLGIKL